MTAIRLAGLVLAAAVLAGCGGHAASPESVVRAWSKALNAGDNDGAAGLFADDAEVIQGNPFPLHTHSQAVEFNRGLPCSGRIVRLEVNGDEVEATFVLGERPRHRCDAPGDLAAAVFRIRHGKIVLWHQVPAPTPEI